ncbi:MAG: polysaccharide biosynthesis/export family protein [Akkermansiaceae bacterium]
MKFTIPRLLTLVLLATLSPLFSQIQAGSSVQVTIMGVPAEEKTKIDAMYFVSGNGTINLPFIGRMRAAGMKPESLAASIQNAYRSADIYTSPTIQVISTVEGGGVQQQVVHLGGQIRSPGPTPFRKGLTIYQAVQAAGGATPYGSMKRVKLYRNGAIQVFDITNAQFMNVPLKPDDTIEIPQKNWLGQ